MAELFAKFWSDGSAGALALRIALILIVTLVARAVVSRLFARLRRGAETMKPERVSLISFTRHVAEAVVYFLGGMTIMNQIPGLEKLASSLLAGSGILALGISIAAQSSLGDLISGVLMSIFKPFQVGDLVRYLDKDITGTVEEITLRHTVIRTFENKRVIIPNGVMNGQAVENATYGDLRVCFFLNAEITYESDLDKALMLMGGIVRTHPDFLDVRTPEDLRGGKPDVLVRVADFLDSGIRLRAFVWAANPGVGWQMKSDLLRSLKKAFDENGIAFAYPHREVIVRRD